MFNLMKQRFLILLLNEKFITQFTYLHVVDLFFYKN